MLMPAIACKVNTLRIGSRAGLAVTLSLLVVIGLSLLQPVSGQPGQWRAINPVFGNLNGVWMISSSSGWAVGDGGAIVRWDGAKWSPVASPATGKLESVSCFSATNCWAVGPDDADADSLAEIYYWDGTGWTDRSASLPAGISDLHSIWIRPDGLGYAVGKSIGAAGFNIIRLVVNPLPFVIAGEVNLNAGVDEFFSIHLLSSGGPSFGFVVGKGGVSYSLDLIGAPGTWTSRPSGTLNDLLGVGMISGTSAFAVGKSDTRLTWAGGPNWSVDGGAVAPTEDWRGISLISSSEGWIVGTAGLTTSTLARRGATGYTLLTSSVPATVNLNSVQMLSASDGFAVGDGGAVIRWNGSVWTALTSPTPNDIRGVWLASTADGWAVGDAGTILRWNGAGWNFYQTSPVATQLNEIHGSSSGQIWAVGNDPDGAGAVPPVTIRWNGGPAWTDVSPAGVANNVDLEGVFTISPTLALAVGGAAAAATLIKWDGAIWGSIAPGTTNKLFSTWWVSSTEGWAVGASGTVVHCTGAGPVCATETSGVSAQLNGVQALTSTNVWAVGDGGTIIHRDGTGWSSVASSVAGNLNSLYMVSATEGWAVGVDDATSSPILLFWDGLTWSRVFPIPAPPRAGAGNDNLEDAWMVASQDGWSVGQDGLILRFAAGAVTSATTIPVTVTSTATSTQSVTATSTVTTATVSTQVTSTQTVSTTATSWVTTTETSTIIPPPSPIPGFPMESILAGLVAGAAALLVLRRRRRT